jgi:hypothetical protein
VNQTFAKFKKPVISQSKEVSLHYTFYRIIMRTSLEMAVFISDHGFRALVTRAWAQGTLIDIWRRPVEFGRVRAFWMQVPD